VYYYLLNRVDGLVREIDERAIQAIDLVSAEAIRAASPDRRHGASPITEPLRQETRIY
jgi:hypothetical protein